MKRSLCIFIWLLALSAFAANPSFTDFNNVHFRTNGNKISLNTNAVAVTNLDNTNFINVAIGKQSGGAFSNVNRYAWRNTLSAIQQRKNWTSLAVMDGLSSVNIIGPSAHNFPTNIAPISGSIFGDPFPYWFANTPTGTGSVQPPQTGLVPANFVLLPAQNDSITYSGSVTNPAADYGIVWFLREPDAASFSVATNFNGGALVAVSGLSLVNASNTAGSTAVADFVEFTNPSPAQMTIVITNQTSGHQVKILSAGFKNRSVTNGFYIAIWNGTASCGWSNILTTNIGVVGPIMSKISPTLILDEHITWDANNDPGGSETYWQKWLDVIATNCPNADHVMCGVYPNTPDNIVLTNNFRMQTNALLRGLGYFDGYSPFVNSDNFTNRGFATAANPDHATVTGVAAYNALLWNWLDLASGTYSPPPTKPIGFDPYNVANMVARYDFNAVSNANGAVITAPIPDLSGNQHDLVSVVVSSDAYWTNNPAIINGFGFAQFTANNFMDGRNFRSNIVVSATNTVFVVAKLGTAGTVFDSTDCARENSLLLLGAGQPDIFQGTHVFGSGFDLTPFAVYEATFAASASSTLKINGVTKLTGNAGSQVMRGLRIGAACDATTKWDGGMAYFIMYNRGLTPTEEGNVTGWLQNRFGINFGVNPAPFTYSNAWLTATNTRKLNISRRGTWEVDVTFKDQVAAGPVLQVTVEDAASVTNVFTCSVPIGVVSTLTNHFSFRVAPLGVVSATNASAATADIVIGQNRMVWE